MIVGVVTGRREATVHFRLRGPGGAELGVDALIDTGFTSVLTLPTPLISALGLAHQSIGSAVLADGSVGQFDVHAAEVFWDSSWRLVLVWSLGDEILLGMGLLKGHELRVAVTVGGRVEIAPLP